MIFSKFFKSSWQSKDSNTRITSINDELDPQDSAQEKTLLTLAYNDDVELVRRAALIKLNSFEHWLTASNTNNNKAVKQYALLQVEAIITGQSEQKLTLDQKTALLDQELSKGLFEAWLKAETDPTFVVSLFKQLDKPQLLVTIFKQHQQDDVQTALLALTDDIAVLEKLAKHATVSVQNAINDKISTLKDLEERPLKLTKQLQLILAKFQALKDVSDYQQYLDKKDSLASEWQQANKKNDCLTDELINANQAKYEAIEQQLVKTFRVKAEAFEQQKIADQLSQDKIQAHQELSESLNQFEQQLTDSIFNNKIINQEAIHTQLSQLSAAIDESALIDQQDKVTFKQQVTLLSNKLNSLPQIAESVSEATYLISKAGQLKVPEDILQLNEQQALFNEWQSQWKITYKKAVGVLPQSILTAYQEITNNWQEKTQPLLQQQNKLFSQTKQKLQDIKRLVNSGKFKPVFGIFKKVQKDLTKLSSIQLDRISRDLEFAEQKIAELSDWEHYIATPRKQSLLEKVQQLVDNPLDNPKVQADLVKEYRNSWNQLGHADENIDQQLNESFNQYCEQAFAPCRQFYAEQEKLRQNNFVKRESILKDFEALIVNLKSSETDLKSLDRQTNQLKQQWRNAGEVDRVKYQKLNRRYNELLSPLSSAISEYNQANVDQKKLLLNQAKTWLQHEDISNAIEQAKSLQQKWKLIGPGNAKADNALWKEFREVNDAIFQRRNSQRDQQQAEQQKLCSSFQDKIDKVLTNTDKQSISSISQCLNELIAVQDEVSQDSALKPIGKQVSQLIKSFKSDKILIEKRIESHQLDIAINVLRQLPENSFNDIAEYETLNTSWKKRFVKYNSAQQDINYSRHDLTILLEIISSKDSPNTDKERRLELQLSLMQQQMQHRVETDKFSLFEQWLASGELSINENSLIERVILVLKH